MWGSIKSFVSNLIIVAVFLAVTWQLYRFPCHSVTQSLSHCHCWKTLPKSTLRDLWPLRHVIRVMRRHDLTNKKTMTKTMTMTMTMTIGEHPQIATPETFDLWDIWSEWWEDMTWPKKTMTMTKTNTFGEHVQRVILENCDLWDIWSECWGHTTWSKKGQWQRQIHLKSTKCLKGHKLWLVPLRHWLHFWQLRTWIHDNLCYLTIKSDTGQHSQFLRCLWHTYRVSLKKGSFRIPAPMEALGYSKGLDISQKHCQTSFFGWLHYF